MLDEIQKYKTIETKVVDTNTDSLREIEDKSFDVVVTEGDIDQASAAHISRILKDDGLATVGGIDLNDQEATKTVLTELTKYFKIAMPYNLLGHKKALLVSKEYHPTADINLQRADLTDGFEVYNSDLHTALFAMPTYIKKAYLGIIRN
jgi:spermidine synthase